jgi:hypothetical protein
VEFTTPDTVSRVVLQLMNGSEQAEIPIDLTETSPKPVVMSSNPNAKLREAQFPMHLRANQEVRLAQTNSTYKILSVELDRSNSSTLLLRFNIRLTNNSGGTTLFWNDSFRLLVEGVPRAPISSLSTTVAAHSAKDGTVEFTTPDTVSRVVLQFRYGDESAEIPIDLTSVQL